MKALLKSLGCLLIAWVSIPYIVCAYEGPRANSVPLNGTWDFVRGTGDERVEAPAGQPQLNWQPVTLPGPFMAWNQEVANQTKFVWARRNFTVTRTQAEGMAVLRWNRIACGAVAFINGRKVGENEPTGSYQVIVPDGVLFPYPDVKHPILAGFDPAWMVRWNGLPGTVGRGPLEGDVMARAEKILWAKEPKTTVTAMVPAASGTGRILFAQLDLQGRLDRSKSGYDPVAERLLLNLLGVESRP